MSLNVRGVPRKLTVSFCRRTLSEPVAFEGTGIHSGLGTRLIIEPAAPGSGLLWRMEGKDWAPLRATVENAVADESVRRTVLVGGEGQRFEQVEHVMAALGACGVTDAVLTQEGPEPPFMGGGSKEFMDGLLERGFEDATENVLPLVVSRPMHLKDGDAELVATPHDGLLLSVFVEFPGTVVGSAGYSVEITPERFHQEVAPARTFALERDLEQLKAAGLAKGGSLENAVVFNETGYLNEQRMFEDEVVRHKALDLLGDLTLVGRPLRGHFWAWRAGHQSHVRFAQMLAKEF